MASGVWRCSPRRSHADGEGSHTGVAYLVLFHVEVSELLQRPAANGSCEGSHTGVADPIRPQVEVGEFRQRPAAKGGTERLHPGATDAV